MLQSRINELERLEKEVIAKFNNFTLIFFIDSVNEDKDEFLEDYNKAMMMYHLLDLDETFLNDSHKSLDEKLRQAMKNVEAYTKERGI